jgi:putative copper export protein
MTHFAVSLAAVRAHGAASGGVPSRPNHQMLHLLHLLHFSYW